MTFLGKYGGELRVCGMYLLREALISRARERGGGKRSGEITAGGVGGLNRL